MNISIRSIITTVAVAAAMMLPALFVTNAVHAQTAPSAGICTGIGYASGNAADGCGNPGDGDTAVQNIISTVIDIFSIIVGAVSVIMIIVGGLRYITSSGDSSNVQAAKNTILYAIVGLVIVIFAQTIIKFVVDRTTTS